MFTRQAKCSLILASGGSVYLLVFRLIIPGALA